MIMHTILRGSNYFYEDVRRAVINKSGGGMGLYTDRFEMSLFAGDV